MSKLGWCRLTRTWGPHQRLGDAAASSLAGDLIAAVRVENLAEVLTPEVDVKIDEVEHEPGESCHVGGGVVVQGRHPEGGGSLSVSRLS